MTQLCFKMKVINRLEWLSTSASDLLSLHNVQWLKWRVCFLMQLPSKSSSHPPRPSDLSRGLPLRRIDNEERRGTCLVANGWWMALGKDIAFTWWTSREDDWGWRARPFAVQCNRNNIYNNLSTAFICDARILVGLSCSLTGSANDKPATRVPWTWKLALKGVTSPESFLYLIECVVCSCFFSVFLWPFWEFC